jgi:hypothetical protein
MLLVGAQTKNLQVVSCIEESPTSHSISFCLGLEEEVSVLPENYRRHGASGEPFDLYLE